MAGLFGALGERFDYAPGEHRPNKIRIGAIAVSLTMIFLYVIYTRPSVPFIPSGNTEMKAEFAFGANVRPGYTPVRVRGVEVGQVTEIERAASGRGAIVTFEVDEDLGVDLKDDARASLRWRTLLGRNLYVDLDPGSPSASDYAGGVIPRSRTQDQVELDTALEPLDATGRGALQTMIKEFDKTFEGQDLKPALAAAPPAMTGLANGLPGLRGLQEGTDLPELVRNADAALKQLTKDELALGNLVTDGSTALAVTAARRADLAATVNTAPAALRQTRATLVRLEDTLDEVDPLAEELEPGLKKLASTARTTQRTLDVARPLLADLKPTLDGLRPALTDLQKAASSGIPAFGPLNNTMKLAEEKYIPWANAKDPALGRPNYQNIGPVASHAGSALSWGDRNGAVGNFNATVGALDGDVFDSPCVADLTNPDISDADKLKCDLYGIALESALLGKKPQQLKLGKTASPKKLLEPYVEGLKKLVLKPVKKGAR